MSSTSPAAAATTFISTVGLKDEGPFPTFKEALNDFITRMKAQPLPLQIVETACWIQRNSNGTQIPLSFYDARDFGFKQGLLVKESEFQPEAPEPDPVLVADLYSVSVNLGSAEQWIKSLKGPVSEEAISAMAN